MLGRVQYRLRGYASQEHDYQVFNLVVVRLKEYSQLGVQFSLPIWVQVTEPSEAGKGREVMLHTAKEVVSRSGVMDGLEEQLLKINALKEPREQRVSPPAPSGLRATSIGQRNLSSPLPPFACTQFTRDSVEPLTEGITAPT
jgi:hypothetical protein